MLIMVNGPAYALIKISDRFTIAAAFGNVHGVYQPGNVQLTPKILKNSQEFISKKFGVPKKTINFVEQQQQQQQQRLQEATVAATANTPLPVEAPEKLQLGSTP